MQIDPQRANQLLASISEITGVINTRNRDYALQLGKILKIILAYLDVEHGSIMIIEKNNLVVKAASRRELIGHKQHLEDSQRIASWVAREGKSLFIPDISSDIRFKRSGGVVYKKESLLSVPILHQGKVVGVLNAADKTGSKDLLQNDISYLLEFSSLVVLLVIRENLNREIKRQRNTLKQRNQTLRRQEILQAEFSKMLIHDLKGPLSEVVANLDILSYSIADENREFLESAQLGCDRAVRMASDLVTVFKLEDGKLKLLREEVEPGSLLAEAASAIKGMAKIKAIKLQTRLQDELPIILLDRVLILRVLQNLLTNSLSYSPTGSTVTMDCRAIDSGRRLEFSIQDQGTGIPAARQQTIFEKYARLSTQQDGLVGTGLGLYFCKLAVELHRGVIGVESQARQGSRFFLTLPLS
jgi:signal transduction histidine kinase